jgi:predicted phage tail protein
MGANPTQALSVLCLLIAFALLAAAFAGGGIVTAGAALVMAGVGAYLFLKCKPWENQGQ